MESYFFSYWWMLVLLTIVVAILTKHLVKIILFVVILVGSFILAWKYAVPPTLEAVSSCFSEEDKKLEEFYTKTKDVAFGKDRTALVCNNSSESFGRLDACLTKVAKERPATFLLYRAYPEFKETLTNIVEDHNIFCKDKKISYPDFRN
jgi:hypothetical protein